MQKLQRIFTTIKKSLKGEHQDFTSGNVSTDIFLLAIPMVLELSLESVFALVDIFFVSKLGSNAVATVGLTESVITIIYSLAIGLSTAATAIVARKIGQKDPKAAALAGAQTLIIAAVMAVIISTIGIIYAGSILSLMGASAEVVREGTIFTRIMLGSSLVIILLFLINGIFRGAGNAVIAMRSLWTASIINIILCPIFIHFFGLKGAAIATLIGRSCGVIYQCFHLFSSKSELQLKKEYFKFDPKIVKSIINIAWPATIQFIIASGSWIVLARLVAETGGTDASAGYQIAIRNFLFFILPAMGLSNAAATLVGQNLGAKAPERAEEAVKITAKYTIYLMAVVMVIFLFFAEPIITFFIHEPHVVSYGAHALKFIAAGYIFFGTSMVITGALNGAGDTKTPTLINFVCFWLIQIPLAYFLAYTLNLESEGVFVAIPITQLVVALMAWYFFKRGKWKQVQI